MRIVKGNKRLEISLDEFKALVAGFSKVVLDLGTGDGQFIYKNALANEGDLYIGVDPAEKQMEIYSKKAVKKKLGNVLFVVGSVEILPEELIGCADQVFINLPWGTLLETLAKPVKENLKHVQRLIKVGGSLETIFGYDPKLEPSETRRLDLVEIDENYIKTSLAPIYLETGLTLLSLEKFDYNRAEIETTWNKKLDKSRPLWKVVWKKEMANENNKADSRT